MLHPLRATARLIDEKIGWNRIGLALSLVIIGTALFVLYRMLRGIDGAQVVVALKATDRSDVFPPRCSSQPAISRSPSTTCSRCARSGQATFPIASRRWRASPAIRSGTMSAPRCSPVARCAIASIRPGD
jgi:hypothetical protein